MSPQRVAMGILRFNRILQQAPKMAELPSVLTFEDKCPQSEEELEVQREKYFNWADTYQNPLSDSYKGFNYFPFSKSILFNFARKHNLSLRVLARDPTQPGSSEIITPGADLKLDADFSYKLYQQVHLTTPYYYDYITFCIKAPGHQVNPDGFVDVFSYGVWLWFLLSAAICTGVMYAVSFSFMTHKFELNLRHSVAFILKSFIIEGHKLKQPKPAVQVFASVWAMVSFVTSTIYLSVVVSSVLSPDPPPPTPETFEDVVKARMKTVAVMSEYENVIDYLDMAGSDTFKHLAQKTSKVKYTVNCLDAAVKDSNTACVAKFRGVQSFLEAKYIDKNGQPRILVSKYRSSVIWTGYAVRKESKLEGILSSFIDHTIATGLVDHWTRLADHAWGRWGIGMGLSDLCSNQPLLYGLWHKVAIEANKNNPYKNIEGCFKWNLPDFIEIVKKHCIKMDHVDSSTLDSMLRVEHLRIIFEAMFFWYSFALVCFILELIYVKLCTTFEHIRLESALSCRTSIIVVKPNEPFLPYPYYW